MVARNLSLTSRRENTREPNPRPMPVHFTVSEIKERFVQGIEESRRQISIASELGRTGKIEAEKSLLRAQITAAEGLLDFYIHEMSKYCLYEMFRGGWQKSQKYDNLRIPLHKVEVAIEVIDSQEWFFEHINDEFSSLCFLGSEPMRNQLNLIGIPYENVIELAFPDDPKEERKHYVDRLFARRNLIVHQNDRDHETATQQDIEKDYVSRYVDKIESLGLAIYQIAAEKNPGQQVAN